MYLNLWPKPTTHSQDTCATITLHKHWINDSWHFVHMGFLYFFNQVWQEAKLLNPFSHKNGFKWHGFVQEHAVYRSRNIFKSLTPDLKTVKIWAISKCLLRFAFDKCGLLCLSSQPHKCCIVIRKIGVRDSKYIAVSDPNLWQGACSVNFLDLNMGYTQFPSEKRVKIHHSPIQVTK